jgi:competence protein ComFB
LLTNLIVINANYDKVLYYIDKMLSENDRFCRCMRCRQDAAALALNTLPPHYFVNGDLKESTDLGSPWILIEVAAREALEQVHKSPHHKPSYEDSEGSRPAVNPLVQDTGTDG